LRQESETTPCYIWEKRSVYHKKSQNSVGIEYVNRINGNRLSKPDQSQQSGLVNCIGKLGILTWIGIGTSTVLQNLSWDCNNRKTYYCICGEHYFYYTSLQKGYIQTRWPNITSILNNLLLQDPVAHNKIEILKINGSGSTQIDK